MAARLDKFVCHATGLSRQQVQRLVRNGEISVNDIIASQPAQKISPADIIRLDGEIVSASLPRYIMLNKPAGYVCANRDSAHPVVLDLLDEESKQTLQIAGRLDIDTTGLLLITDDGEWNHKVTSPNRACSKTYRVALHEPLSELAEAELRKGILLNGEKKPTKSADIIFVDNNRNCILLTIYEGKYHQVKRMLAAVGNHVVALHRESVGAIELDTSLATGEYRFLTPAEVGSVS